MVDVKPTLKDWFVDRNVTLWSFSVGETLVFYQQNM